MESKISINFEVDLQDYFKTIENLKELNDNDEIFKRLAAFQEIKDAFAAAEAVLAQAEKDVKAAINNRAKALYGSNWEAIAGSGYKITHSMTGSVFALAPMVGPDGLPLLDDNGEQIYEEPDRIFCSITLNTENVKKYVEATSELPEGVMYNPKRGESIRISIKPVEQDAV